MTGEYISLVCQGKSRNTWRGSIYHWSPVIYTPPSCVSGFTLRDQWYILPCHVFRDLLWQTSDIYSPSCTGEYISLVCQSKSRNTWRGSIYHWSFKVNPETHDGSCVSGFTLKDHWYILPRHVFRDLLWKTSDIYSPVLCFGIYFERPVIYTPPSCVSGFTLKDQWYILPIEYISLVCQGKSRNTW
jgi:hypothetical protein